MLVVKLMNISTINMRCFSRLYEINIEHISSNVHHHLIVIVDRVVSSLNKKKTLSIFLSTKMNVLIEQQLNHTKDIHRKVTFSIIELLSALLFFTSFHFHLADKTSFCPSLYVFIRLVSTTMTTMFDLGQLCQMLAKWRRWMKFTLLFIHRIDIKMKIFTKR